MYKVKPSTCCSSGVSSPRDNSPIYHISPLESHSLEIRDDEYIFQYQGTWPDSPNTLRQPVHECSRSNGTLPSTDIYQHEHQGTIRLFMRFICTRWWFGSQCTVYSYSSWFDELVSLRPPVQMYDTIDRNCVTRSSFPTRYLPEAGTITDAAHIQCGQIPNETA